MKLLVVSVDFPFPANNGHRLRNWALLQALAMEGHEVSLLTFTAPGEPSVSAMDAVRQNCRGISTVPLVLPKSSIIREYSKAVGALFSTIPYSVLRFRSPAMQSNLKLLLKSEKFDAVLCETCYPLVNFPPDLGVPLILDNHNLEHVLVQRYGCHVGNPARRAYAVLEWRKLRHWECSAWKRAHCVALCSEHDRATCTRLSPGVETTVVPNVVDVDQYRPESTGDGATILYVGGMDWLPNRDAVQFFVFQILPGVRKRFPDARFVVAGRSSDRAFQEQFRGLPVSFTGTVADMRPEIAQANVCVVPLRIGSGTRLKILETAAMGKAIVSTRIGAEGLDFMDGEEIVIENDPEAFARAVASLLNDPKHCANLGRAARGCVSRNYSLVALREAVGNVLTHLHREAVVIGPAPAGVGPSLRSEAS